MPMEPALRTRSSRPVGTRVGTPGVPDPGGHGPVGAEVVNAGSRPYAGVAMSTTVSARRLLGRHSECAALDQLVASVRAGPSGALVLRGGAGVGKTALLDYLAQHSSGCGIARAAGVESDGARVRGVAAALRAVPGSRRAPSPARSAMRLAPRSVCATATRRTGSSSAWRSSVCSPTPRKTDPSSASWTTRSGSMRPRHRRWRSSRRLGAESVGLVFAVREPTSERHFEGCQSSPWAGLVTVMRTSYSQP